VRPDLPSNGILDSKLRFGLRTLRLGHEQPSVFIGQVKSGQRRYKTSTWSLVLNRGKKDI